MAQSPDEKSFHESHPYPDKYCIPSLFRFYKIDLDHVEHLKHLFTDRKLYHSLPSQFNDPFECKPHFTWPQEPKILEQHFIKLLMGQGHNKNEAEEIAAKTINDPKLTQKNIQDTIHSILAKVRICSFTTSNYNLLLWSHYANSHRGFCVEFDATKLPISSAFKVKYSDEYPKAIWPPYNDLFNLIPLLVKSEDWSYEEEFRTLLVSWAKEKPDNDGESLILSGNEIKNVYLGSNIEEKNKMRIIDIVKQGDFNPRIWTTSLSKSSFSLEFSQID
jgi:hypothetical protein